MDHHLVFRTGSAAFHHPFRLDECNCACRKHRRRPGTRHGVEHQIHGVRSVKARHVCGPDVGQGTQGFAGQRESRRPGQPSRGKGGLLSGHVYCPPDLGSIQARDGYLAQEAGSRWNGGDTTSTTRRCQAWTSSETHRSSPRPRFALAIAWSAVELKRNRLMAEDKCWFGQSLARVMRSDIHLRRTSRRQSGGVGRKEPHGCPNDPNWERWFLEFVRSRHRHWRTNHCHRDGELSPLR
jgi:hypothetical protein